LTKAGSGNPFLWPLLWKANQDLIPNPDLIQPGQTLEVPVYTQPGDIAWAIAFADAKPDLMK
jgi:nucleoid-associated protein YgaU